MGVFFRFRTPSGPMCLSFSSMKAFKGRKLRQIFNLKHNCINIKSTIYFDCILHSQATAPILCDPKIRFKELNIIQTIHDFLYKTEWKRFVPRQNVNYFNYLCSRPYDHQIIFSNFFFWLNHEYMILTAHILERILILVLNLISLERRKRKFHL